ncbi:BTAD domain-containing putative transcriptional regulator [Streptomyces sp. NPDC057496]|uniref:AfsR/SARP family transcriptional regulator n=1 Tax=Streptomyces sp. NPDC057496 TaxID=3346149 RepID=UPI0036C4FAD0
MHVEILGPLFVGNTGHDPDCAPSAPKPRQLLALLALNANQFVPTNTCIDELWMADPPRSAVTTLRTYVMRIRRALQSAGAGERSPDGVLRTGQHGYQLFLDRTSLDLFRFTDQVDEGKRALLSGDHRRGAETLRNALSLWKGSPLVDVQVGPSLTAHQVRLQELRLSCIELRVDAELRLGLHQELISELTGLTAEFPTHENLHAQLMLALFRSGRQAQALLVYRQIRAVLANELGIEPFRRLRQLHNAVLLADPALDPPCAPSGGLPLTLDLVDSRTV